MGRLIAGGRQMKLLKVLLVLVFLLVLAGGYLGIIPGVSKLFGSDKPRNLGKAFDQAIYDQADQKIGMQIEMIDGASDMESSLKYEGVKNIDVVLTDDEVTSMVQTPKRWKYNPFSQIQVRFNGSSVETSAMADVKKLMALLVMVGVNRQDMEAAAAKYNIPLGSIPVYLKGTGKIENNQIQVRVDKLEIGRIGVPVGVFGRYVQPAADLTMSSIESYGKMRIERAEVVDGKFYYTGQVPERKLIQGE